MKLDQCRTVLTVIFFITAIYVPLHGQEQSGISPDQFSVLVDRSWGQDQELVNGLQYYNRHPRSLGHPYLLDGLAHPGSVTLRGKLHSEVRLRYDIHDQQLEAEYMTISGANNQVILVLDRVDEFTIGNRQFRRLEVEGQEVFHQLIGDERLCCYIRWEKKLVPVSGDSRFTEEYTSPRRSYLLQMDGWTIPFQSKSDFVKLFPEYLQKQVRKLFRSMKLNIRTAAPEQLELLLFECADLLEKGGNT